MRHSFCIDRLLWGSTVAILATAGLLVKKGMLVTFSAITDHIRLQSLDNVKIEKIYMKICDRNKSSMDNLQGYLSLTYPVII